MSLEKKQIHFQKPSVVSQRINEGVRALAERYNGRIGQADDHCINRIDGLTEARLISMRSKNPPSYTRDGQIFVTVVWVLFADGMLPHRPVSTAREWLVSLLDATNLFESSIDHTMIDVLVSMFSDSIAYQSHTVPPAESDIRASLNRLWQKQSTTETTGQPDSETARLLPPYNRVFVGRNVDVTRLKQRLGIPDKSTRHPLTILRGWPGVGKTALINAIARDDEVENAFKDGVLWASMGRSSDIFSTFKQWARQLNARHLLTIHDLNDLREGIRAVLAGRDILVLVDDIWEEADGNFMKDTVDLKSNTVVLSTRFTDLANRLKDVADDVLVVKPLSQAHGVELLSVLAPESTRQYRSRMPQLVTTLEGLPLALCVAGPLLAHYHRMGFPVEELLDEFESDYNRLLESIAPADRFDEDTGTTPTIEILFRRSVETLHDDAQLAFASLGVFEHKPATFDAEAMQSVWQSENPRALISTIVGRGLLEPTPDRRFRMHQTLHMYANKLIDRYDEIGSLF